MPFSRLQRYSKTRNTEQGLENQALLEQISERTYCETPEEAETSEETRGTPEVFSVSWANSAGQREATLAALETEVGDDRAGSVLEDKAQFPDTVRRAREAAGLVAPHFIPVRRLPRRTSNPGQTMPC